MHLSYFITIVGFKLTKSMESNRRKLRRLERRKSIESEKKWVRERKGEKEREREWRKRVKGLYEINRRRHWNIKSCYSKGIYLKFYLKLDKPLTKSHIIVYKHKTRNKNITNFLFNSPFLYPYTYYGNMYVCLHIYNTYIHTHPHIVCFYPKEATKRREKKK